MLDLSLGRLNLGIDLADGNGFDLGSSWMAHPFIKR